MGHSESQPRIGVGIPSVLMVLVVLAMAALCMLSYSSATSTESMTRRNAEVSAEYYQLAAAVQERLAQLDEQLILQQGDPSVWMNNLNIDGVTFSEKDGQFFFSFTATGNGTLSIAVEGLLLQDQPFRYRVLSHRMQNIPSQQDAPYLELMGGGN